MKDLLLINAYISWRQSIISHDKILNGLSTLNYQKEFVVSLHNSVELFLKQLMINSNDHEIFPDTSHNRSLSLWDRFKQSTDIASFLSTLNANDLSSFHSIGFTDLIKKYNNLMSISSPYNINTALKTLQELRNNETHFYIDNNLLSEEHFILLHNFMVDFYNDLLNNNMFPYYLLIFNSGKPVLPIEYEEFCFDRKKLDHSFTYLSALQNSTYVQLLSEIFDKTNGFCTPWGSTYSIAKTIVFKQPKYENQFTEILSFLELARKNNMLEYSCETVETNESSELIPNRIDLFSIRIKH